MKKQGKTLLLVDGNALIHRGFHAIPHLSTKSGEPTNGVYGFALLFLNALKEINPDFVAVCFDLPGATFRSESFKDYKGTRVKAPDELYEQIPRVKEMVQAFNVPIFEVPKYEADDLIGTLSKQAEKAGVKTIILTGDYDTLQLVSDNVLVLAPKTGLANTAFYGPKEVGEKYGLKVEQMVDYKALRGDPSDNIPGVSGIGEKTAIALMQRFGDLDSVYAFLKKHPDGNGEIKPRIARLLIDEKDQAYLSKQLSKIDCEAPVQLDLAAARLSDYDEERVIKIFQTLEFRSLLSKIPKSERREPRVYGDRSSYRLVKSEKEKRGLLNFLADKKEIVIDTETTSEHPVEAELIGVGFGLEQTEAFFVPAKNLDDEIIRILEDPKVLKIGHNIKYDYIVLKRRGINLQGKLFDTMIAAYLLNPGARTFDLDSLVFNEFGYRKQPIEDLIGKGKTEISIAEVPIDKVAGYCCEDVDYTGRLKQILAEGLKNRGLMKIFEEIEMPLVPILADMELTGIKVDKSVLEELSEKTEAAVQVAEKKIFRLAGEHFNIGSPIQLKKILFEKLNVPSENLRKGKTGFSTAATELEKLRGLHPIVDLISEWRELTKLKNTYFDALPALVNPRSGRIHTSFNQTIAATGRLSSSDPNLQNIPVRTPLGKEARRAFIAEKKHRLLSVDYSQIELRIAAHLSGDKKMIKVFREGGDIHTATAQEIFGAEKPEQVTAEQRRYAKVINFGILYGLSAYGLTARIPEVGQIEAREFIEKYRSAYATLIDYLDEVVDQTRRSGLVKNELGRIRNLPEIKSSQFQVRSGAERAALNMPMQSLAADVIKLAMVELNKQGLVNNDSCRLLLQVHDELVFEVAEDEAAILAKKIVQIMEGVYKLKVPLLAEPKIGKNWGEMKRIAVSD